MQLHEGLGLADGDLHYTVSGGDGGCDTSLSKVWRVGVSLPCDGSSGAGSVREPRKIVNHGDGWTSKGLVDQRDHFLAG